VSDQSHRALAAAEQLGLAHTVTQHGPVRSLEEAAEARGVSPHAVVKTMVVRLADDDYRFVLVPGDQRPVSLGGGAHGVALTVDAGELVAALDATVADVTDPA
jgi:Cys-tRNA(Pro)/Cys-tRNA(Cys) deacylase